MNSMALKKDLNIYMIDAFFCNAPSSTQGYGSLTLPGTTYISIYIKVYTYIHICI